jgi:hypothetical protein
MIWEGGVITHLMGDQVGLNSHMIGDWVGPSTQLKGDWVGLSSHRTGEWVGCNTHRIGDWVGPSTQLKGDWVGLSTGLDKAVVKRNVSPPTGNESILASHCTDGANLAYDEGLKNRQFLLAEVKTNSVLQKRLKNTLICGCTR